MSDFIFAIVALVVGLFFGFLLGLPYADDTNKARNQERLDAVSAELNQCLVKNKNCEQEKTTTQRKLEVANDLITQQGLAVMNCLLLHDPSQDSLLLLNPSLLLLNPSFSPPSPPVLSP